MSSGQLGQQGSTLPVKTVHLRKPSLRVKQHLVGVPDELIQNFLVTRDLVHRQQILDGVGGQTVDVVVLAVADEHVERAVALLDGQLGPHLLLERLDLGGRDRALQALD